MEIVKKNILSIICGVIALAALVFLQWPVGGWYADEQKILDDRVKVNDDLSRLRTTRRHWPVMPDTAGAQTILDHFPNDVRIAAGKQIEETVSKQAGKMKDITAENNKHMPLLPDVLPFPGEQRFAFQRVYPVAVQKTLPAELQFPVPPDPTGAPVPEPVKPLPPTNDEVYAESYRIYRTNFAPKIITVAGNPVNKTQVDADWQEAAGKLQHTMRQDRAQKLKMYVDDDAISISKSILNAPGGPKESEIWYAQSSLWVEQDLVAAIKRINETAADVTVAPVKHLMRLNVAQDQTMYVNGSAGGMSAFGAGGGGAGAPAVDGFLRSPTGRQSNPLYDVIHFSMTINVEASRIPQILSELQKGKLITITHVNASSVDGLAAADNGFLYGDVPVAHLYIEGEDLFLRDWTAKLMPEPIKAALGVVAAPPGRTR
ncbi:MAG TPA: hypothetical protein VG326_09225 [Tepidisphaeraceae bacterium]|jgi:hypothetical protein|nr:hypothetical protein [Tepidisphaeraceae bacterium]